MTKNLGYSEDITYDLNQLKWGDEKNSSIIILAIHGYKIIQNPLKYQQVFLQNLIL